MTLSDRRQMVSVIIPVLDEASNLRRLLPGLARICPGAEIIVVDGGSTDGTDEAVRESSPARLVLGSPGRARQMNAGAREARGDVLLFLHADTVLPDGAAEAMRSALADPRIIGGRFDVRLDNRRLIYRTIGFFMNLRSRLTRIATGDQAIFVRRHIFTELGGYPEIPLMEDVEFTRRLKRRGATACIRLRVTASARKWEREGVVKTVFLMWMLRLLYFFGVSPARLHALYYGRSPSSR